MYRTYTHRLEESTVSVRTQKWEGNTHPSWKSSKYHPAPSAMQPHVPRQVRQGTPHSCHLLLVFTVTVTGTERVKPLGTGPALWTPPEIQVSAACGHSALHLMHWKPDIPFLSFSFLVMNQNIAIKNILREILQVSPATSEDNEKTFKEEINLQFSGHYN